MKNGTIVNFNIDDLDKGEAVIRAKTVEDNHVLYRIEVISGSFGNMHRNEKHELWVNDYEVTKK